jgi:hypothetical protein
MTVADFQKLVNMQRWVEPLDRSEASMRALVETDGPPSRVPAGQARPICGNATVMYGPQRAASSGVFVRFHRTSSTSSARCAGRARTAAP